MKPKESESNDAKSKRNCQEPMTMIIEEIKEYYTYFFYGKSVFVFSHLALHTSAKSKYLLTNRSIQIMIIKSDSNQLIKLIISIKLTR